MPQPPQQWSRAVAFRKILSATPRLIPSASALPSQLPVPCLSKSGNACQAHAEYRAYATEAVYRPLRRRFPNPPPPPSKRHATTPDDTTTPQLSIEEMSSIYSQELFVFRSEVTANQVLSAMHLYPQLREINILTPNDTSNLARQLHNQYRFKQEVKEVLPHIQAIIKDMQRDAIPGHPLATVHIISTLKDMQEWNEVNEFWKWAEKQGPHITDARAYGAMIEAIAYQGQPLPSMERLYSEAFERFSRMDPQIAKETGATRIMLLQGIITARLLNGEWQSAYEAFDLILRLYPTATPPRVYELFIYERPLIEGFIVFLMACRAGAPPNPAVLTPLLKGIWHKHKDAKAMLRLVWAFVGAGGRPTFHHLNSIIKGMLLSYPIKPRNNSTEAKEEYEDGWRTMMELVRQCIQSFLRLNIRVEASTFNTIITCGGTLGKGELVVLALKDMLAAGVAPTEITYRALVKVAGDLGDREQLEAAWEMLVQAKIERRARIGNVKEILRSRAWLYREEEFSHSSRVERDSDWDAKDWMALINAGVPLGKVEFVSAQLDRFRDDLPRPYYTLIWNWIANAQSKHLTETRQKMNQELDKRNENAANNSNMTQDDWDYLKAFKATADAAATTLRASAKQPVPQPPPTPPPPSPPDSKCQISRAGLPKPDHTIHASLYPEIQRLRLIFSHPIIQNYCPSSPNHISIDFDLSEPPFPPLLDKQLQDIYDEITELSKESAKRTLLHYPIAYDSEASQGIGRISPTGLTLRELRFENWKSINKLLFEAECDEHKRIEQVKREQSGLGNGNKTGAMSGKQGFKFRFWKEDLIKKKIKHAREKEVGLLREQHRGAYLYRRGFGDQGVDGDIADAPCSSSPSHLRDVKPWKEEQWKLRKIIGGGGIELKGEHEDVVDEDVTEYQNWTAPMERNAPSEKSEGRSGTEVLEIDSNKYPSAYSGAGEPGALQTTATNLNCSVSRKATPKAILVDLGPNIRGGLKLPTQQASAMDPYPDVKESIEPPTQQANTLDLYRNVKKQGQSPTQATATDPYLDIKEDEHSNHQTTAENQYLEIKEDPKAPSQQAAAMDSPLDMKEETESPKQKPVTMSPSPNISEDPEPSTQATAIELFSDTKDRAGQSGQQVNVEDVNLDIKEEIESSTQQVAAIDALLDIMEEAEEPTKEATTEKVYLTLKGEAEASTQRATATDASLGIMEPPTQKFAGEGPYPFITEEVHLEASRIGSCPDIKIESEAQATGTDTQANTKGAPPPPALQSSTSDPRPNNEPDAAMPTRIFDAAERSPHAKT